MAVAFGSIQTATSDTSSGSLEITKPTGLSVGDLMIAVLGNHDDATDWTHSGWTALDGLNDGGNSASNSLFKIADSSDVAASSFVFTGGAGADETVGCIIRVTGDTFAGAGNIQLDLTKVDDQGATTYTGGVTPLKNNDLLIMVGVKTNAGSASSYAVANNNPSWAERADVNVNDTEDIMLAVATATFATVGATGDYSLTYSTSGGASYGYLFGITETTSISVTGTTGVINLQGIEGVGSAGANVAGTTGIINIVGNEGSTTITPNKWSDTDKSSTPNWVNRDKS